MTDASYNILQEDQQYKGYVSVSKVIFEAKGPDGQMAPPTVNTVVNAKNGVIAVLYDPQVDKVLLTEEFRIATVVRDDASWGQIPLGERPTGRLLGCVLGAAKPGEKFEDVVRREAREESGSEVKRAVVGPTFFLSGPIMPNFVTAYALEFDSTAVKNGGSAGLKEECENIGVKLLSLNELNDALDETSLSRTMSAESQAAVSWFLRKQPQIKAEWTKTDVPTMGRARVLDEPKPKAERAHSAALS